MLAYIVRRLLFIVPTLLGTGKQSSHPYLYWQDPKSRAVRMDNWKAIQPGKNKPFELYDLSKDIQELNDVAKDHPDVLTKMKKLAWQSQSPGRSGKVLDPSLKFDGHKKP